MFLPIAEALLLFFNVDVPFQLFDNLQDVDPGPGLVGKGALRVLPRRRSKRLMAFA